MRENRTSGTVRGVPGNRHSYRGGTKTMLMLIVPFLLLKGYDELIDSMILID